MTNLAITAATATAAVKQKPVSDFAQIPNYLYDLAMTGSKHTPAAAYQTLCFILRLHPDTVITPENISDQLKIRAVTNRGKYKKPETIRAEFIKLAKAGFILRQFNRAKNGGSLATQYGLNYGKIFGGGGGEKSPPPKTGVKPPPGKQKEPAGGGGENSTPPLYKVRAHDNTRNTNTPSGCVSVKQKNPRSLRRDFFAAIPARLRDKNTPVLVNSLVKYFGAEGYALLQNVFANEAVKDVKKIDYLFGAVRKRKAALNGTVKPQSLTKPKPPNAVPANPQKGITDKRGAELTAELAAGAAFDARFEKCVGGLTGKQKMELLGLVIPQLSPYTVNRLHLTRGNISPELADYYLANPQVRHAVMDIFDTVKHKFKPGKAATLPGPAAANREGFLDTISDPWLKDYFSAMTTEVLKTTKEFKHYAAGKRAN